MKLRLGLLILCILMPFVLIGAVNRTVPGADEMHEPKTIETIIKDLNIGLRSLDKEIIHLHSLILVETEKMAEDGTDAELNEEIAFMISTFSEVQKSTLRLQTCVLLITMMPFVEDEHFAGAYHFVKQNNLYHTMIILGSIEISEGNLTEISNKKIKKSLVKALKTLSNQVELIGTLFNTLEGTD